MTKCSGWVSIAYNSSPRRSHFYVSVFFSPSLESCSLTTLCCLNISKILIRSHSLIFLNLSTNNILDDGVELLCEALRHPNCHLERLSWVFCFVFCRIILFSLGQISYELNGQSAGVLTPVGSLVNCGSAPPLLPFLFYVTFTHFSSWLTCYFSFFFQAFPLPYFFVSVHTVHSWNGIHNLSSFDEVEV